MYKSIYGDTCMRNEVPPFQANLVLLQPHFKRAILT